MVLLGLLFAYDFFAVAQENSSGNSGPWSGVIINSGCTLDEAFAEEAKCTDAVPGAKLVLFDNTIRQIYELDPQSQGTGHLGDSVTAGAPSKTIQIHVSSLEVLNSIRLPVGKKAPAFSARDQFGHDQSSIH